MKVIGSSVLVSCECLFQREQRSVLQSSVPASVDHKHDIVAFPETLSRTPVMMTTITEIVVLVVGSMYLI
jgi:hypothetical protein